MSEPTSLVTCWFSVRTQVTADPTYRYQRVWLRSPLAGGELRTPHPPQVGDQIYLYDEDNDSLRGEFRVLGRSWLHDTYGSPNWPYTKDHPGPPILQIIVEACDGLFLDEAPSEDDDE